MLASLVKNARVLFGYFLVLDANKLFHCNLVVGRSSNFLLHIPCIYSLIAIHDARGLFVSLIGICTGKPRGTRGHTRTRTPAKTRTRPEGTGFSMATTSTHPYPYPYWVYPRVLA